MRAENFLFLVSGGCDLSLVRLVCDVLYDGRIFFMPFCMQWHENITSIHVLLFIMFQVSWDYALFKKNALK